MPKHVPNDPNFEQYPLKHQIDMVCDCFETDYRASGRAEIEDYLPAVPGDGRSRLLAELVAMELELSPARHMQDRLQEYLGRFPQHGDTIRRVFSEVIGQVETVFAPSAESRANSFLASSPLFSTVPSEELESAFRDETFETGQYLMRQGEPGLSLMVISAGTVEVSTTDSSGQSHVIDRAGKGHAFGEMALLTDQPRTASVRALSPVRASVLEADTFHRLAHRYPQISTTLTHLFAERLGRPGRDALTDKVLDNFRIHRRLGRGGMGIVYEATDLSQGQRRALKMMSHRLVYAPEALARFQQEADIIETFEHPHIVRMYGRFAAFRTYFIVLEYCPGQTLEEVLAHEGPLDQARFQHLVGKLALALEYAHRSRVVHRDLKPSNIMVTGSDLTPKLMDFGLAEPVTDADLAHGCIAGTPRYMAPEQRTGEATHCEADYFAFGCLVYEMLTGQPLFQGDPMAELARSFQNWIPPALTDIRPDVDPVLLELLQSAFAVVPAQRRLDLSAIAARADRTR